VSDDALIGHLHRRVDEAEQHASHLTEQLAIMREAVAAIRASVNVAPLNKTAVSAILDGYGL